MKFRNLLREIFLAITTCAAGFGLLAVSGEVQNTQSKIHKENIVTQYRSAD